MWRACPGVQLLVCSGAVLGGGSRHDTMEEVLGVGGKCKCGSISQTYLHVEKEHREASTTPGVTLQPVWRVFLLPPPWKSTAQSPSKSVLYGEEDFRQNDLEKSECVIWSKGRVEIFIPYNSTLESSLFS